MEQIVLLLVMLAGATQAFFPAAETQCVVSSNSSSSTCKATLGATVYIQVMNNASSHQVKFKKQLQRTESTSVFSLKKDKVVIQEVYKSRVEVFIGNGTMKIMHVQRNDSGQYSIEIFSPNGLYLKNIQLTLDVQDPPDHNSVIILASSACGALLIVAIVALISHCVCRKMKRTKSGQPNGKAGHSKQQQSGSL